MTIAFRAPIVLQDQTSTAIKADMKASQHSKSSEWSAAHKTTGEKKKFGSVTSCYDVSSSSKSLLTCIIGWPPQEYWIWISMENKNCPWSVPINVTQCTTICFSQSTVVDILCTSHMFLRHRVLHCRDMPKYKNCSLVIMACLSGWLAAAYQLYRTIRCTVLLSTWPYDRVLHIIHELIVVCDCVVWSIVDA